MLREKVTKKIVLGIEAKKFIELVSGRLARKGRLLALVLASVRSRKQRSST